MESISCMGPIGGSHTELQYAVMTGGGKRRNECRGGKELSRRTKGRRKGGRRNVGENGNYWNY